MYLCDNKVNLSNCSYITLSRNDLKWYFLNKWHKNLLNAVPNQKQRNRVLIFVVDSHTKVKKTRPISANYSKTYTIILTDVFNDQLNYYRFCHFTDVFGKNCNKKKTLESTYLKGANNASLTLICESCNFYYFQLKY